MATKPTRDQLAKMLYRFSIVGTCGVIEEGQPDESWKEVDRKEFDQGTSPNRIEGWCRDQIKANNGIIASPFVRLNFGGVK